MSEGAPNQSPLPNKRTRWISLPPVWEQSYKQFSDDATSWETIKKNATAFYKKPEDKDSVARLITEIPAAMNSGCTYLIYHFITPRGVAVVTTTEAPGYATIRYILGDGSEWGIGMTLIEAAANFSQKNGCNGKLRLIPDNDGLVTYYEKLGFKITEKATSFSGPIMTVTPQAPQWIRNNEEWRLQANEDQSTWR